MWGNLYADNSFYSGVEPQRRTKMASSALGITTVLQCLSSIEAEIGLKADEWKNFSPKADPDFEWFLENQASWRPGLKYFDPNDLKGFATRDLQKLMEKMEEWEMQVKPPKEGPDGSVYAISKLLEMVNWKYTGEKVFRPGIYPEFLLSGGIQFWSHPFSSEPLISIETEKATDTVWITRTDEDLSGLALVRRIDQMVASRGRWSGEYYSDVQIPCIKAKIEPSLNWLVRTMKNMRWFIYDANQLVLFGMNELGFVVLEETSMTACLESIVYKLPPYIVSPNGEGFIFGRTRNGVNFPISALHLTREDFKDPGDLKDVVKK